MIPGASSLDGHPHHRETGSTDSILALLFGALPTRRSLRRGLRDLISNMAKESFRIPILGA